MHRLLKRQIRKSSLSKEQIEEIRPFLEKVNQAYLSQDEDIDRLENILEINSQELFIANEQERSTLDARTRFLSTMSHEIRTPLNAVIGIANLLLMEKHLPEQEKYLRGLKFSTDHLLALINDILDYNKIESGNLQISSAGFRLSTILDSLHMNFSYLAGEKGISFEMDRSPEVPDELIGDSTRLSQILNNLLSNAIKYTPKGFVRLLIQKAGQEGNHIRLRFSVVDSGVGIRSSKIKKIFKPFYQMEETRKLNEGGTGLGLTISKRLISLLGEELHVDSKPGKGSTFRFELPFGTDTSGVTDGLRSGKREKERDLQGLRVLVAEDNTMNILLLTKFLNKWNSVASIAKNGREALQIYHEKAFDLILMDLQMPEMDGYEACSRIRKQEEEGSEPIPIIALSASDEPEIIERAMQCGMDGFLVKPFNPAELYRTLAGYRKRTRS